MTCIFCATQNLETQCESKLAYAIFDKFPVNRGHMLIIPKRHFQNFFEATKDEILDIYDLIQKCKKILEDEYNPDGYNIGINVNEEAGQTIMHLHVHLIPRYNGDVDDPRGGIRNLKPQLVPYKG